MENDKDTHELSNEEKKLIFQDSQKYTEELESLEKMHKAVSNDTKVEDNDSNSAKEDYNIEKNRKTVKSKSRTIDRKLGYHRRYLYSNVKISNVILIIIFILMTILVIGKYALPNKVVSSNTVTSSNTKFGDKIDMKTKVDVNKHNLNIKVEVKNGENTVIKFNPASIKMKKGENIFTPIISDKDKEAVSADGIKPGESVSFSVVYNIEKGSASNSTLETIVIGTHGESCRIIAALGI